MRILVLGFDTRSFLSVIRSLGRAGHDVYVASAPEGCAALSSRYIHKRLKLIVFHFGDASWTCEFQKLLNENSIDLVIPCNDQAIIPMQAVAARIDTKAKLFVLPDDVFRIVISKAAMYRIAEALEIPLAKGILVSDEGGLRDALRKLNGPWVFKPPRTYSDSDLGTRLSVIKAYEDDHALAVGRKFLARGEFLIQENFIGVGTGVEVLCDKGDILIVFQHLRLHEPLEGGGSSYRKGIPIHPGMLDATRKIVSHLNYTGVAMFEFKWNQASGKWIFIELNARFWGSLPLAVASGADFPRALVDLLMLGTRSFPYDIRPGLYGRNIALDIDWFRENFRADKTDPTLAALPWRVVLKELVNIFRGKERWDTFALDDIGPFISDSISLLRKKSGALGRRILCSHAFLAVTRSARRRRLLSRLRYVGTIGFVCAGNICRSPYAESYARKQTTGFEFFSAGLRGEPNRRSPDIAIAAAGRLNHDLSQHKSRKLTFEAVGAADIIFVFDRTNLIDMYLMFPESKEKVFLLSDLNFTVNIGIDDPIDYDLEMFCENYRTIQACIDAMPDKR